MRTRRVNVFFSIVHACNVYARACEDANLMQSGKRGRDPGWPVEGDHYEHQDDHFDNCDGDDYGH